MFSKSEFVTLVSHEFRTPLTTILSSSAMLESYYDRLSPERRLHHLQKIQQQVKYLDNVMEDILRIGHVEGEGSGLNPEVINLDELCTTIIQEIQSVHTSIPKIEYTIQGNYQRVWVDTKLVRLILNNLLSNAIKYSPKESVIQFRV